MARCVPSCWPTWAPPAVLILLAFVGVSLTGVFVGTAFRATQSVNLLFDYEFTPAELVKLEAAFANKGLWQYSIDECGRVTVPKKQRSEFITALNKSGAMPGEIGSGMATLFDSTSFLDTPSQRQLRYKIAKQHDLSRMVASITGIDEAYVYYDVKHENGFRKRTAATATVVVRPSSGTLLEPTLLNSIRKVVAGSVVDLKPDDITITDLTTTVSYSGKDESNESLHVTDEFFTRRRRVEESWNQKISRLLDFIPNVCVVSNVELGFSDPPGQDGLPSKAGRRLVTRKLAVSVSVPSQYYQQMWEQSYAQTMSSTATTSNKFEIARYRQETERDIRESIKALNPNAKVQLISIQQIDNLPTAEMPHLSTWLVRNSWIFTLILGIGVAGTALWWLKPEASQAGFTSDTALPGDPQQIDEPLLGHNVPPLVDEEKLDVDHATATLEIHDCGLTEVVRENPTAAADVLKDWLGKAG